MKGYKAIQESVWPKYTLYVCVRPGVRPSVLPAHVCGPVCGHVCCQMVCAAMCAARWCSWCSWCSWYLLWRSSRRMDDTWEDFAFYAWRSVGSVQKWLSVVYIGGVCGWEGCEAANTCVWPHTQVCSCTLHVLECLASFWFLHFELTHFHTPTLIITRLERSNRP